MSRANNPYGDGKTSQQILNMIKEVVSCNLQTSTPFRKYAAIFRYPKSFIQIYRSSRVGFSWSALRVKFSNYGDRKLTRRDPGGDDRRRDEAEGNGNKTPYNLMKDLGYSCFTISNLLYVIYGTFY
jgi:hypothetical protein